jgi:hypothetical protein
LPDDLRRRTLVLWETAVARARDEHQVSLDAIEEPLQALIIGRLPLIVNDTSLKEARVNTAKLIDLMMHEARQKGWSEPREFFLNSALAHRRHLFPFTD